MAVGRALEIGCGRGVGVEIILRHFGADSVDAFDLDPRMVERARARLGPVDGRVHLWVGDATQICVPDEAYDAVFDFGIIHHVPDWRRVLGEVHRVLKPGGTFYAEEVLRRLICHPVTRRVLRHPQEDRFDTAEFRSALETADLVPVGEKEMWGWFVWFAARKRQPLSPTPTPPWG